MKMNSTDADDVMPTDISKASTEAIQVAHQLLFDIGYGETPKPDRIGLCYVVHRELKEFGGIQQRAVGSYLRGCAKDWSLFSGNDEYPVPHPDTDNPGAAFMTQTDQFYINQYGDNRRCLARYWADKLQEVLNERGVEA
jgi:hypothetical protein